MNGKKRYIPIVALGALLISLLAILPVAAAGEVGFIDPGDINENNTGALTDTTPDTQEWARQGGQVGILVDDSDLNNAVKRVLLPGIDTVDVGNAEIKRNSNVIKFTYTNVEDLATTTGVQTIERNDLIMVGRETLRKVTKVEWVDENDPATANDATDDTLVVTLDRAFRSSVATPTGTPTEIHRVKQTYVESTSSDYNAFDGDGYKTLASGLKFSDAAVDLTHPGLVNDGYTDVALDRDIVDSGIGSHIDTDASETHTTVYITPADKGLSRRLKSAPARGVRNDDVLVLQVENPTNPATINIDPETYPPVGVDSGGSFRVVGERDTGDHLNAYVLFWSSEGKRHRLQRDHQVPGSSVPDDPGA